MVEKTNVRGGRTGLQFILVLSLLMAALLTVPASAKEALEVIGGKYDFGYVPFRTIVKHKAILVNRSDSLIKITRVQPGCGCTQMPLTRKDIAPAESLEIELILDTGKIHEGLFQKAPTVYTDSRETPRVTISLSGINLKADARQPQIRLTPMAVALNPTTNSGTIEIKNGTSHNIFPKILNPPKSANYSVEMPRLQVRPGDQQPINIKMKLAPTGTEPVEESFTIEFNDYKQTRFTIPVTVSRQ